MSKNEREIIDFILIQLLEIKRQEIKALEKIFDKLYEIEVID